jgi:hypothetical protein
MKIRKFDTFKNELTPEEVNVQEDRWIDMSIPHMGFVSFEVAPGRWLTIRISASGTWSIDDSPVVS